jgi:hypothetical protein
MGSKLLEKCIPRAAVSTKSIASITRALIKISKPAHGKFGIFEVKTHKLVITCCVYMLAGLVKNILSTPFQKSVVREAFL